MRDALSRLEASLEEREGVNRKLEREIEVRSETQARQKLALEVLSELNKPNGTRESIEKILEEVQKFTDLEGVAVRLRDGDDFPYFAFKGFPESFIEAENCLCARDVSGDIIRDADGNPYLVCMCGNIIMGRTDPARAFFTENGSFWSNCTTELLATTTDEDRQVRTRNRCNRQGYESVALIPLRDSEEVIGVLQLNDRRANRFSLDMIHFMEEIGAGIGIAITRSRMREAMLESMALLKTERPNSCRSLRALTRSSS